jgi:hypothetical protein
LVQSTPSPPSPPPVSAAGASSPAKPAEQPSDLRLPNAEGEVLGIRHAVGVRVSKTMVVVDGRAVLKLPPLEQMGGSGAGPAAKRGPNDLFILPLGDSFEKLEKPAVSAVLYLDADLPFRLLVELVFTINQSGADRLMLATHHAAPVDPDRAHGFRLTIGARSAAYTTFLVADGMSVKSLGANVAPGCQSTGAGLAVPKTGESYDFKAFTACIVALKPDAERASQTQDVNPMLLALTANPATRYEDIVLTMQAARDAGLEDFQLKIAR